jgi:hypothetical protein
VDVGILYDTLNFQLTGTVDEWVDHSAAPSFVIDNDHVLHYLTNDSCVVGGA